VTLYVGHALAFVEYMADTPPRHCRLTKGQLVVLKRELRKVLRLAGRTVLGHQAALKQQKQQRLVTRESLLTCQSKAKAIIPTLLSKLILILCFLYKII